MATARFDHTATLLPNGKVLVAGGQSARNVSLSTAELFDTGSGTWTNTGSLTIGRRNHTATLLTDGKVLVAGGCSASDFTASAELYDPTAGKWTKTGSMLTARELHTAFLLTNGKVLVVGGRGGNRFPPNDLTSAELYDPATGKWTETGALNDSRCDYAAALLSNGKIMAIGGRGDGTRPPPNPIASVEIYDPTTEKWKETAIPNIARQDHIAVLLSNGEVLVAGGAGDERLLADSEIYDPAKEQWTTTGKMNVIRVRPVGILLSNGIALVTGGVKDADHYPSYDNYLASAELYDPKSGIWTPTGEMHTKRCHQTLTLLPNMNVLVAGGQNRSDNAGALSSTEIYDPSR